MAHSIRRIGIATVTAALALGAASLAQAASPANRSLESVHQPVVDRTDLLLDVATTPSGLAPGEAERLAGWFDGLRLGYGDTVTIDDPAGWRASRARDGIAAVVSDYGMLVSHDAPPVTVGHPRAGTVRVVVSRAVAHVEGCPDWSRANNEYAGGSTSNFGCATANSLAAMIANPQDLIEGHSPDRPVDASLSVKAIKTYRDAPATGAKGLKEESSRAGGGSGGGSN